ncbi:uncharacterized protein [Physcomitrium patens]|uniref:uncharacterized protein isoform X3 n=1 Tax=Physcomitrium patens TaxID=3218 RepID=UPI003CCDBFD1
MELAEILHPGLGAIMDPILNLDKPEQPGPSTHATDRYPTDRTNIPIMIGEIPPVPTPLMGAIRIRTPGGPEVIEYRLVAAPKPGPHEVLIRVVAASMNEFDSLMRKGVMSIPPGEIVYPGVDCSGVVAAVGPGATRWQLGDEVCAWCSGGAHAMHVVTHEDLCLPIPKGLTCLEAAALPEVSSTIILSIFTFLSIANNAPPSVEPLHVLITGGGSGGGTLAIQYCKAQGCKVYCTTSTLEKTVKCEQLGAHLAINCNEEDFVERIWKDTQHMKEPGVDMVLDVVGASWTSENLRILKREGRIFMIAASLWRQSTEERAEVMRLVQENIWPLVEEKRMMPIIEPQNVFIMEKAVWAHRLVDSQAYFGKIMLVADPEKVAADNIAMPVENRSPCD